MIIGALVQNAGGSFVVGFIFIAITIFVGGLSVFAVRVSKN